MVILKFNKLIRNKWVWGVFALLVSIAFIAPDGCLGGDRRKPDSMNKLSKVEFDQGLFFRCDNLVRSYLGIVNSPLSQFFSDRSADDVWKAYAAALSFREMGCIVTDEALLSRIKMMPYFSDQATGAFSSEAYKRVVTQNLRMSVSDFEEYLRLVVLLESGLQLVRESEVMTPVTEVELAARDFTDKFTVRIAEFTEDKAAADAVKVDEAAVKKWYDENSSEFALPERYKVRYVKLNPLASNVLAKVSVSESEIEARYNEDCGKGVYDILPATTNDVKKVKPLADVRPEIEVALKNEAARKYLYEYIRSKMPQEGNTEGAKKFLAGLAAAENQKIVESEWFAFSGRNLNLKGFTKSVSVQFPGVKSDEFQRKVKSLPYTDLDIISSDKAIWVFEAAGMSEAHTPKFEEVKALAEPKALAAAKADLFKKNVETIKEKGVAEILKSKNVTTNITFKPCQFAQRAYGWNSRYGGWDFSKAGFANAEKVVFAARKLAKGAVSDVVSVSKTKALLVVCSDRTQGDYEDVERGVEFGRFVAMSSQGREAFSKWLDWNLDALGYERPVKKSTLTEEK